MHSGHLSGQMIRSMDDQLCHIREFVTDQECILSGFFTAILSTRARGRNILFFTSSELFEKYPELPLGWMNVIMFSLIWNLNYLASPMSKALTVCALCHNLLADTRLADFPRSEQFRIILNSSGTILKQNANYLN